MNSKRFHPIAALLFFLCPVAALAKPATTLKIPETSEFASPTGSPWFTRLDLSGDLAFRGTAGLSVSVGRMSRFMFWDVAASFFRTAYGSLRVYQSGADTSAPLPDSELGRARGNQDGGLLFGVGPGIGFLTKVFESEHWVQMGRFGLSFAQWQDLASFVALRGVVVDFRGSVGYQAGRFIFAPGVAWDLGYMARAHNNSQTYLPLELWSAQFALYYWL